MKILVYGSRLFGRVVRSLVEDCGHEFAGYIDDFDDGPDVLGRFGQVETSCPPSLFACVNAVGYSDLAARRRVSARLDEGGYARPVLVHPRAFVASTAALGAGSLIMAMASVDHRVALGEDVVVWPSTAVSHDSRVGANTFLSPGCVICGDCLIGRDCFVGAGAVVVSHARMPDGTFVKALTRYATSTAAAAQES